MFAIKFSKLHGVVVDAVRADPLHQHATVSPLVVLAKLRECFYSRDKSVLVRERHVKVLGVPSKVGNDDLLLGLKNQKRSEYLSIVSAQCRVRGAEASDNGSPWPE